MRTITYDCKTLFKSLDEIIHELNNYGKSLYKILENDSDIKFLLENALLDLPNILGVQINVELDKRIIEVTNSKDIYDEGEIIPYFEVVSLLMKGT